MSPKIRPRRCKSKQRRKTTIQSTVNIQTSSPKINDTNETKKSKIVINKDKGVDQFEYDPELSNRKRKETTEPTVNTEKCATIPSPVNNDNDETNKSKIVVKKEKKVLTNLHMIRK